MIDKILYIDDKFQNNENYVIYLNEIAPTQRVASGEDALTMLNSHSYGCIVVDVNLPKINGHEVVQNIKLHPRYNGSPILFVSSDEREETKIRALSCEVDDYLCKSMKREEIQLRVKNRINIYRKNKTSKSSIVCFSSVSVDPINVLVSINESNLDLTILEYKIIFFLVMNKGAEVSKETLVSYVWGDKIVLPKTLNTHLSNLRSKLSPFCYGINGTRGKGISLIKLS
jgi:DNA-binding response OmpR family regulator